MVYDDDERIDASQKQPVPEEDLTGFASEKTVLDIFNRVNVPLTACNLNVLLQLKGTGSPADRPEVDIVAVLDVSGSMRKHGRIDKLKTAMKFIIKKLGPTHRLSIVTFSRNADRKCKLRKMTPDAQDDIQDIVAALIADGGTNMQAGLEMALQVLEDRKFARGRVGAIMLMSDGDESIGSKAASVRVDEVPVYTFGVGADYTSDVLNTIASNSDGGTFSPVEVDGSESSKMGVAFALCLAGLLTVAVQDLQLTMTPVQDSTLGEVRAGKYKQTPNADGSTTITFGDLYEQEIRRILLNVNLPEVKKEFGAEVVEITYSYKVPGDEGESRYYGTPISVTVTRTKAKEDKERDEILLEQLRLSIVDKMKDASVLADANDINGSLEKLREAKEDLLKRAGITHQDNDLVKTLNYELDELAKLTEESYDKKGRHFSNASQTSHALQRAAARGNAEKVAAFVTEVMKQLVEQFTTFDKNPSQPPPTFNEDTAKAVVEFVETAKAIKAKEVEKAKEAAKFKAANSPAPANTMANLAVPLAENIGKAISALQIIQESLEAIQKLLNSLSSSGTV